MQSSEKPRSGGVILHGRSYRVHESGPADSVGATVVLVHGIGMTHRSFAPVQAALPATRRVLNFDLAGFGPNPAPSRGMDVEEYATDLAEVIGRLGAWPAVVAGHSMGTQITVELSRIRPQDVLGIALIGPVVDPDRRTIRQQMADLVRDSLREPPTVNGLVMRDYARGGIRWYLEELRAMMAYPMLERLADCAAEVLVIRGARDPIARRAWCRRLVAASGGPAGLSEIPGKHHVVPRTATAAVTEELIRLTERVERRLPDAARAP